MKILDELRVLGVTALSVTNNLATAVNPYDKYRNNALAFYMNEWIEFEDLTLPPLPAPNIPDDVYEIERFEVKEQFRNRDKGWMYWNVFPTCLIYDSKTERRWVLILKEQVEETAEERLNRFIGTAGKPDCPKCRGKGYILVKTTMPDIPARRTCECTENVEPDKQEEKLTIEESYTLYREALGKPSDVDYFKAIHKWNYETQGRFHYKSDIEKHKAFCLNRKKSSSAPVEPDKQQEEVKPEFLKKLEQLGINDTNIIERLTEVYPELKGEAKPDVYNGEKFDKFHTDEFGQWNVEKKPEQPEQCPVKFSDLASYVLYDTANDAYIPLDDSDLYFHISGGKVNGVFYRSEEYYEGGG